MARLRALRTLHALVAAALLVGCADRGDSVTEPTSGSEVREPRPRAPADLRDVTFTTVGALRLGMSEDEARAAYADLQGDDLAGGCRQLSAPGSDPVDAAYALIIPESDGRIVGIIAPTTGSTTDRGVGTGSRFSDVRAAYADREIEEADSQLGHVMLVRGGSSWLSFSAGDAQSPIDAVRTGDHDYAMGYESCSDM